MVIEGIWRFVVKLIVVYSWYFMWLGRVGGLLSGMSTEEGVKVVLWVLRHNNMWN